MKSLFYVDNIAGLTADAEIRKHPQEMMLESVTDPGTYQACFVSFMTTDKYEPNDCSFASLMIPSKPLRVVVL
ncbi:hypothetical protein D918_03953 [Trichuris suis]|nr:hypothetical protein D918_03953 [Trichuris suis]